MSTKRNTIPNLAHKMRLNNKAQSYGFSYEAEFHTLLCISLQLSVTSYLSHPNCAVFMSKK